MKPSSARMVARVTRSSVQIFVRLLEDSTNYLTERNVVKDWISC